MKMATCNVHIMDGHLMGVAPKFLRLCLKALKLVQSSLQELILPDFLQWCPKVTGRKDRAKSLPFKVESGLVVPGALLEPMMGTHKITAEVEIDSKLPIVGDQKWDFMDLFLQYANSTWEDLLNCLQCSKLLPVHNAMVCMVADAV